MGLFDGYLVFAGRGDERERPTSTHLTLFAELCVVIPQDEGRPKSQAHVLFSAVQTAGRAHWAACRLSPQCRSKGNGEGDKESRAGWEVDKTSVVVERKRSRERNGREIEGRRSRVNHCFSSCLLRPSGQVIPERISRYMLQ
jgi:hypothetical protein